MVDDRHGVARARALFLPAALALPAWLCACGPQVEIETDSDSDASGSGTTATEPTSGPPPTTITTVGPVTDPDSGRDGGPGPTQRAVDILFVVDNTGSMSEEQAKLTASLGVLTEQLDAAEPPVDYRIGVTTTDNGNPWCGATTPEGGSLRATSCRSRAEEFVFDGAVFIDATQEACYDQCELEELGITDGKPWIDVQRSTGTTNVDGDAAASLRCMLPQGIDGCGFEGQLESMWKAARRFETDGDPAYGFHREGALLAVMLVTDEVDCSSNPDWDTIFLPEGDRVFWSDPTAASPTSAVCWHAGVACAGDQCQSVDLDVAGNETADPDLAVLRPVARYTELFQELGAYAFAIYGVGLDGSVVYQPSFDDPQYQNDFGIGPGCQSPDGTAVPPVRERELVAALSETGPGSEASICADVYEDAMGSFANGILGRLP
jgi:hypothetical protein